MCSNQRFVAAPAAGSAKVLSRLRRVGTGRQLSVVLDELNVGLRVEALAVALLSPAKGRDLWSRFF